MPVNWNLFTPPDISGKFDEGWKQGRAQRDERDLKSALAAYSENPNDPAATSALARLSPQFATQMAAARYKEQAEIRERQRIGALLGPDPSGVPAGINGQPKINFRERQMAALRAGDTAAAAALGAMADDQERIEKAHREETFVENKLDNFTGRIYSFNKRGDLIGDDQNPYLRDANGVPYANPKYDIRRQSGAAAAPAGSPDPLAPEPPQGTPSGHPLDGTMGQAPPATDTPKLKILADAMAMINAGADAAAIWAEAAKHGVYPPGAPQ